MQFQEYVLRDLFSGRPVPEVMPQNAIDHRLVPLDRIGKTRRRRRFLQLAQRPAAPGRPLLAGPLPPEGAAERRRPGLRLGRRYLQVRD